MRVMDFLTLSSRPEGVIYRDAQHQPSTCGLVPGKLISWQERKLQLTFRYPCMRRTMTCSSMGDAG